MARRPKKPSEAPTLEVAIEGPSIGLEHVDVRHLASLLEATAALLEAVQAETKSKLRLPFLAEARKGSAAYDLSSAEPAWPIVVEGVLDAVDSRGAGHSSETKEAMARLHRSAKIGAVRVKPYRFKGVKEGKPRIVAMPVNEDFEAVEYGTIVHGRVFGITGNEGKVIVSITPIDGGPRENFQADFSLGERAAALWGKTVQARVTANAIADQDLGWKLVELERWGDRDFLEVMGEIRDELAAKGVKIDADAWMRELDDG